MDRIINKIIRFLKNKLVMLGTIFLVLSLVIYGSYSYIASTLGWRVATRMKYSNLTYSLSTTSVTATPGTNYYNITVTSLNEIRTKYFLTYKSASGDSTVKVSSLSLNDSSGLIGAYDGGNGEDKTKTIRIVVENNDNFDDEITLNAFGGYTWNNKNNIRITNNYLKIEEIYKEDSVYGKTLSEYIDLSKSCTPSASLPCYYTENENNYLNYAGQLWRILGTYNVNGTPTVKIVLADNIVDGYASYSEIDNVLTDFYDSLTDTSYIKEVNSKNIDILTKAEYESIGKDASYLYSKPEEDYWLAGGEYKATDRGVESVTGTEENLVRPVVYLKEACFDGEGTIMNPHRIGECINLTVDLEGATATNMPVLAGQYMANGEYAFNTEGTEINKSGFLFYGWDVSEGDASTEDGFTLAMGEEDVTIRPVMAYEDGINYVYPYKDREETFNVPTSGQYKLEVWGASGGNAASVVGGLGGYSTGTAELNQGQTLYINVGGKGTDGVDTAANIENPGGYNGGGSGYNGSSATRRKAGGGGATHMATRSGLLSTLENYQDDIYIVAGGGGGATYYNNDYYGYSYTGSGGGYIGADGTGYSGGVTTRTNPGGMQDNINVSIGNCAGTFGEGASCGINMAGGGGGYYGGSSLDTFANGNAGGGSGYIANSLLTNKYMYCYNCPKSSVASTRTVSTTNMGSHIVDYANTGNGYARITALPNLSNLVHITFKYSTDPVGSEIVRISGYYLKGSVINLKDYAITSDSTMFDKILYSVFGDGYSLDVTNNTLTVGTVDTTVEIYQYKTSATYNYDYSGHEEAYIAPASGNYKLEVWGAQGGLANTRIGGYGGYSTGVVSLNANDEIYVYVGGKGTDITAIKADAVVPGGYNGGGAGTSGTTAYGAGGGGATHIATRLGLLSSLENNQGNILIVAGGGSGGGFFTNSYNGSSGGGFVGIGGTAAGTQTAGGQPGGTTTAGTFGQGGGYKTAGTSASGGGGGFYGGGGGRTTNPPGGGSGYIGNSLLTNKYMYCYNCEVSLDASTKTYTTADVSENAISDYAKSGNGYATITHVPNVSGSYITSSDLTYVEFIDEDTQTIGSISGYYQKGSIIDINTLGLERDPMFDGLMFTTVSGNTTFNSATDLLKIGNASMEIIKITKYKTKDVYSFTLTSSEQIFKAEKTGKYRLEVWGAQGGLANTKIGGYGGYSTGVVSLSANDEIYVYVGGKGTDITAIKDGAVVPGGYNGGGAGTSGSTSYGAGGGGATHIATSSGLLSSLESSQGDILIVAGGGSGGGFFSDSYNGRSGGGFVGIGGTAAGTQTAGGQPGGTATAGTFGKGGGYKTSGTSASGGGGGFYGGGGGRTTNPSGGGSGYIGNSLLTNKYMYCYNCESSSSASTKTYVTSNTNSSPLSKSAKRGDGYAVITYLPETNVDEITLDDLIYVTFKNANDNSIISSISGLYQAGAVIDTNSLNLTTSQFEKVFFTSSASGFIFDADNDKIWLGNLGGDIYVYRYKLPTWNFSYIDSEDTFAIPSSGSYKLEVWGAQGGTAGSKAGGYGGYATGNINLNSPQDLFINVGGQGTSLASSSSGTILPGGYNGGGNGISASAYGVGGGGATHIALSSGLLSTLENNQNDILIVAGGGGGGYNTVAGGHGGGMTGTGKNGGTQTAGGASANTSNANPGAFGQGGSYKRSNYAAAGGGGGFYGGSAATANAAGGGSGYIANTLLTNKYMYCYSCTTSSVEATKTYSTTTSNADAVSNTPKLGSGHARISLNYLKDISSLVYVSFTRSTEYSGYYVKGSLLELPSGARVSSGTGYSISGTTLIIGTTDGLINY